MRIKRHHLFWPSMTGMFLSASAMGVAWHETVIVGNPAALRPVVLFTISSLAFAGMSVLTFPSWERAQIGKESSHDVRVRKL